MMDFFSSNPGDVDSAACATEFASFATPAVLSNLRPRSARKGFGVAAANQLLAEKMAPWIQSLQLVVEACSPAGAVLRLPRNARLLRLGNTICGPALMACADTAMAIAIMGSFGDFRNVATVCLNVDFMRPVAAADIRIAATVRHEGRSLIFTECSFVPECSPGIAVHATATWAVIPSPGAGALRRERGTIS
jgi:uncharacterized protein (TIGR00369 family)